LTSETACEIVNEPRFIVGIGKRRLFMKKAKVVVLSLVLLVLVLSAVAGVSELWPGLFKEHNPAPAVHNDPAAGTTDGPDYVLPEPAAVLLLGAGLVSLGLYARLKRGKQR
jgi:hypothetical protein